MTVSTNIPPAPINMPVIEDGYITRPWAAWFQAFIDELKVVAALDHADLNNILPADDTDTDATFDKHVSNNMVKGYADHVAITNANPHGTDHSQLDAIGEADETDNDATKDKHVSNLQMKTAYDDIDANTASIKSLRVLHWLTM